MYANDNVFMGFISDNYDNIKESFKKKIRSLNLKFSDDVFSDTIIKCNEKLSNKKLDGKNMLWYFWTAFRINTIRDLGYSRNKTTDKIPEISIVDNIEVSNDFNTISNIIKNKFGNDIFNLFMLHANGTSYSDLEKISNIPNLKYKFRRLREYVRKEFKKGC